MKQEFKAKPNLAVGIFSIVILLSTVLFLADLLNNTGNINTTGFIVLIIFDVVLYFYLFGCRPTKYIVGDRQIIMKKRIWKDKVIDLMEAEVITDPVPRMADLITRPHAIELYMNDKKLYKFFPNNPVDFTGAVVAENKRIHCAVAAYTDIHRSVEKRERKRRKKEENRRRRESN